MHIPGKTALVTGGAHRVGKAITLMLANAGANVVVNYNSSGEAAEETLTEVKALGVEGLAVQCDVSDYASVGQMSQRIVEHFGGVDIIINGASLFGKTPFPVTQADGIDLWHTITRISIDGAFYVCNALVPSMQARGGGAIVNIVDLSLWQAWRNFTAHAVGKAGLWALTRQLALELAPAIRVNAVAPGLVLPPPNYSPEQMAESAKQVPLHQWGSPQDVAQAVRYLLEADFVTGEVLVVDGGQQIGKP